MLLTAGVWGASREGTLAAPEQRVPVLVAGVDIRTLPLTAIDGFVFSRIDGRSTTAEIIAVTGLPGDQVMQILGRLVELGAVQWEDGAAATPTLAPPDPFGPATLPPRSPPPGPPSLRTPPPRMTSLPPGNSSTPPRRRSSMMMNSPPRRMLTESSISGPPPPDPRTFSQRPGVSLSGAPGRGRTPVPSPARRRDSNIGGRPPSVSRVQPSAPPLGRPGSIAGPVTPVRSADVSHELPDPEQVSGAPEPSVPAASAAPLYDPRELDEQVDLPRERRVQILDLYYRLPKLDYYEVLGLSYGADKKQIRAAYFALSKVFHPDSMFRKELGSFKVKMTKVFQYLTEAYDALGKKKTREEYDIYLRSTRSIEQAERALATDEVAAADANVEVPRPPLLPSTRYDAPRATPTPEPAREASPEARRMARELLERRLRGGKSQAARASDAAPEPVAPAEPPAAVGSAEERQQLVRQLTRTLIDIGRSSGNSDKLTRALGTAKAAFERGELAQAVQHMARATSLAPERHDIHTEYERLSRMLANSLADNYIEQAKFEVKQGKWAAAALSWAKVCEGRPDDAQAQRAAAFSLLKAGGDMRGAQKYAQRAVQLAPTDVDARILLAQICLTVGLKLNAKRELDAAAKLDPENEMVKNLLSDLKT